jgi:hypothetical protein
MVTDGLVELEWNERALSGALDLRSMYPASNPTDRIFRLPSGTGKIVLRGTFGAETSAILLPTSGLTVLTHGRMRVAVINDSLGAWMGFSFYWNKVVSDDRSSIILGEGEVLLLEEAGYVRALSRTRSSLVSGLLRPSPEVVSQDGTRQIVSQMASLRQYEWMTDRIAGIEK